MVRAFLLMSMLALWFSAMTVKAAPNPAPAPEPHRGYLSTGDDDELPELEDHRSQPLSELRTVLSTIKEQFREIIEELMSQVLNYIIEILLQIKLKLLKKLALYSLSDVLSVVFDGLTDFFVEPVPDYYAPVKKYTTSDYGYGPFSLASLLSSKKY